MSEKQRKKIMTNRIFCLALCALLFALGFPAQAQRPKKIPRIGYLSASSASFQSFRVEAFRQGLRELGYVEGKNIVIEYRYAEAHQFGRERGEATSTSPNNAQDLKEVELAAGALGVKLQYLDVRVSKDIEAAFRAVSKERADAVLLLGGPMLAAQGPLCADLAIKNRLPAIYWRSEIVEAGGLMSYGVSQTDLDRRAATYVDKILKGAKPADLPVEQPTKFEFVINMKAAKQIGLTIPQSVLYRVDKVIR